MTDQCTVRRIVERNIELLALKPSRGHLTCTTRARLADGLRCEIEEGPGRLAADLPAKVGGEETAPTPGVLGRAALAGCLTIGIAPWAARPGVPLGSPGGGGCRSGAWRSRSRPTSTPAASSAWATASRPGTPRSATWSRSRARRPGT